EPDHPRHSVLYPHARFPAALGRLAPLQIKAGSQIIIPFTSYGMSPDDDWRLVMGRAKQIRQSWICELGPSVDPLSAFYVERKKRPGSCSGTARRGSRRFRAVRRLKAVLQG